uniref:Amino acid transporter transmembrane domain-containing protein n=1 Tax=Trieres chinensis TaxID=1514140 RepID=A0A7S2EMJ2_TRICV
MTMKRALAISSTYIVASSVCPASAFSQSRLLRTDGALFKVSSGDSYCRLERLANDEPGRRKRSLALASSIFGEESRSSKNSETAPSTPSKSKTTLAAVASDALDGTSDGSRGLVAGYADVASAALLITGNTVGASMMVLPSVAAGPGMIPSAGLFLGLYAVNLISGLLLAEVAIEQKEMTGVDAPSSFKQFAAHNLGCESTARFVSAVSIFVNSCILTFDLTRAGQFASARLPEALGAGSVECTAALATGLVALVATQTDRSLSRFASVTVGVLFVSFAGFLLPGLASMDPSAALLAPGSAGDDGASDVIGSLSTAAPVFLTTMVYQNIVPSVTKILDYDRTKTTFAIIAGSFLPLVMYLAFCYAALGGGLDVSSAGSGPLFAAFAAASLAGSAVASLMSLAEEYGNNLPLASEDGAEILKSGKGQDQESTKGKVASLPSVVLAGLLPMCACLALANGGEPTAALSTAGSYGSPLLYGVLPVAMVWNQRRDRARTAQDGYTRDEGDLVPGGASSLVLLGAGALLFVLENIERDIGGVLAAIGMS